MAILIFLCVIQHTLCSRQYLLKKYTSFRFVSFFFLLLVLINIMFFIDAMKIIIIPLPTHHMLVRRMIIYWVLSFMGEIQEKSNFVTVVESIQRHRECYI